MGRGHFIAFQILARARGWYAHLAPSTANEGLGSVILVRQGLIAKCLVKFFPIVTHYISRIELWKDGQLRVGVTNTYSSPTDRNARRIQIRALGNFYTSRRAAIRLESKVPPVFGDFGLEVLTDDFNMTFSPGDRWVLDPKSPLRGRWTLSASSDGAKFVDAVIRPYSFQEVPIAGPTLRSGNNRFYGRNDRFSTNLGAHCDIISAQANIMWRPWKFVSDHVVISLQFQQMQRATFRFADWNCAHPSFAEKVETFYRLHKPKMKSPWMCIRLFNLPLWIAEEEVNREVQPE